MSLSKTNFKKELYIYISQIIDEIWDKAEFKVTYQSWIKKGGGRYCIHLRRFTEIRNEYCTSEEWGCSRRGDYARTYCDDPRENPKKRPGVYSHVGCPICCEDYKKIHHGLMRKRKKWLKEKSDYSED